MKNGGCNFATAPLKITKKNLKTSGYIPWKARRADTANPLHISYRLKSFPMLPLRLRTLPRTKQSSFDTLEPNIEAALIIFPMFARWIVALRRRLNGQSPARALPYSRINTPTRHDITRNTVSLYNF